MVRSLRVIAAITAALCAAWTYRLIHYGGIRFVVGGHLIRSYDYQWVAEIGALAFAVFVVAGGWGWPQGAWRSFTRVWSHPNPRAAHRMALVIVAGVFVVTFTYQATTCGGSDSSGYMSQAVRWIRGDTSPEIPWASVVPWPSGPWSFTPLGYTPSHDGPPFRMAPIYAPGLPWLLAAAMLVGGPAGMSVVEPLACAMLVLAAYGIGRRARGPWTGLTAAWLLATSPILLFTSMTTMSDVPAGAAWAGAFYFLIGAGQFSALASGFLAALAITIRPNLAFLAAMMTVWFAIRPTADGAAWTSSWRERVRDALAFGAGVIPGILAIAIVYARWYGSPFESGYGSLSQFFAWANVRLNVTGYAAKAMASEPVLFVAAITGLVLPWLWTKGRSRRAMALAGLLVLGVTAEYTAYVYYGDWTFLRFFLVIWALVGVAAAGTMTRLASGRNAIVGALVIVSVIGVGLWGVRVARQRSAFEEPLDRHYAAVGKLVSDIVPARAVVFCFMHSGSLRYYSGRLPIRWDVFFSDWLDESVRWLSSQGVQSYAVLEEWEVQDFRKRFSTQHTIAAMRTPVAIYRAYQGRWTVFIFNLSSPPAPGTTPRAFDDDNPMRWRNWPPGPEPTLTLTSPK